MAIETIKCQECGSAEVTEFKPGSYVCGHCEAVFKHVDPRRLVVGPAFCGCGNPIEVRCTECHTGMCRLCDVGGIEFSSPWKIFVRTQGFGYVLSSLDLANRSVVGNRPVQDSTTQTSVFGPAIPLNELLWARPDRGTNVRHVCCSCIVTTAPIVADLVSDGTICEAPGCVRSPVDMCRCCSASLCEGHITGRCKLVLPVVTDLDVCPNCVNEHLPGLWFSRPPGPEPVKRRMWRSTLKAAKEREAETKRRADDICARAYEFHTAGPCQRRRVFKNGLPKGMSYVGYEILDERPAKSVVALSLVTTYPR